MRITVTHTLDDLESDFRKIYKRAPKDMAHVARANTKRGNRIAKAFASEQHTMFGDTDIQYPPSFTWEMLTALRGEYGPDASIGGGAAAEGYEHGSMNSPPHHDLARSSDLIGPMFARDVSKLPEKWFWPS
jgi:hypothetical protein